MAFNSLTYLIFLPLVYLAFYFTGSSQRWFVLLAASIVFYGSLMQPHLLAALVAVIIISYIAGIRISTAETDRVKKAIFLAGISANLLILISFRYLPFIRENLNVLWGVAFPGSELLPVPVIVSIAVSFYVFQAISYLIDVYLEIEEPERHLGIFALYLGFFPKLLQGPIERSGDLLPQLRAPYEFDYENMRAGLLLFGWGLFKKVVIADRLGFFVDAVYGNVTSFSGFPLLLATWLYAFQIFFDFSGYTDMALGAGRLFNIRLTQNFNGPYLATSIADFWRRWHISFSRWILDYLFKPLQMRLRDWKNQGTAVALLVTFIASGVWHGASWGFIIWGGMHGVFLASSVYYKPWQKKLHASLKVEKSQFLKWWQIFVTFNLVCLSWIFFRAESVSDAWYVLTHLVDGLPLDLHAVTSKQWIQHNILLDQSWREAAVVCLTLMLCVVISIVKRKSTSDVLEFLRTKTLTARWALYYALLCALILFAVYEKGSFIYYQF